MATHFIDLNDFKSKFNEIIKHEEKFLFINFSYVFPFIWWRETRNSWVSYLFA